MSGADFEYSYSVNLVVMPVPLEVYPISACLGTVIHGTLFGEVSGIFVLSGPCLAPISAGCTVSAKCSFVGLGPLHGYKHCSVEEVMIVATLPGHLDGTLCNVMNAGLAPVVGRCCMTVGCARTD